MMGDLTLSQKDRSEAIALLIAYRHLAKKEERDSKHNADYWSYEIRRTQAMIDKLNGGSK
jgi:hypothetical protein